jgi:hypothetical protein
MAPYTRDDVDLVDAQDISAVGAAVASAIASCKSNVPNAPVDHYDINRARPLYDLAGVATWAAFVRGAKCMSATAQANEIRITPTVNLGARGGFGWLNDKSLAVPTACTHEELGRAVIEAATRSE